MTVQNNAFLADTRFFSPHARPSINEGRTIADYSANRETVLQLLNSHCQNRRFAVPSHRQNFLIAQEIQSKSITHEFWAHSSEEQGHIDRRVERFIHGEPNFSFDEPVSRGQTESEQGESDMLFNIIREYRVEKRIAIDDYREIIQYFNIQNPMMQCLMKGLPSVEKPPADARANRWEELPGGIEAKETAR